MHIRTRIKRLESTVRSGEAPHGMIRAGDGAFWPIGVYEKYKRFARASVDALMKLSYERGMSFKEASGRLEPMNMRVRALLNQRIETKQSRAKEQRFNETFGPMIEEILLCANNQTFG